MVKIPLSKISNQSTAKCERNAHVRRCTYTYHSQVPVYTYINTYIQPSKEAHTLFTVCHPNSMHKTSLEPSGSRIIISPSTLTEQTYIHTYSLPIHTYIRCMRNDLFIYMHLPMHTRIITYIHLYIQTNINTFVNNYIHIIYTMNILLLGPHWWSCSLRDCSSMFLAGTDQ